MKFLQVLIISLLASTAIHAQVASTDAKPIIPNFKISGYVHAQYQVADTAGASSFAAGNFATGVNNRFTIRRGRLKGVYENKDNTGNITSGAVFQIDYSERGVAIRDAYAKLLMPFAKQIGAKIGAMDKFFSYELVYSSSIRETPERGRMSQILLPSEKDLGATIWYQPLANSAFHNLKIETGLFNGTGVTNADFDNQKDWITKISHSKKFDKNKMSLSGGASYYLGGHKNAFKNVNKMAGGKWLTDSNAANINKIAKQEYIAVDAQASADFGIGATTLRAEYVWGTQAGGKTTTSTPRVLSTEDTYMRNFDGAYLYFIQNILQSKHQIIVKYDWYDPNTKAAGLALGNATSFSNATIADIKYSTLGLGYSYTLDKNFIFLIYRDFVKNEVTSLNNYKRDLKDNILTLRVSYRFS